MASFIRLAFLFQFYTLVFFAVSEFSVTFASACYSDDPIYCYENPPDSVRCDIHRNLPNSTLLGNALTYCTEGKPYQKLAIIFGSFNQYSSEIPLNVSDNITSLEIETLSSRQTVRINPLKQHLNMTRLSFEYTNWDIPNMLSSYFPNLQRIDITGENSIKTIDNNLFRNLISLSHLSWRTSALVNISEDCFRGLSSLSYVDMSYNQIPYLYSETFQHLPSLNELLVSGSQLNCTCRMQWMSKVDSNYWIEIVGECKGTRLPVDSPFTYSQCHNTESYQCFNKSVNCETVCINTASSYICACAAGYGLTLIEAEQACHDIDECVQNISLCEGMHCRNTLGSYQCYCGDGLWLAGDGSSCHDIDECVQNISLCEGMHCRNTLGSFQCYCQDGFWLAGDGSSCHDIDECVQNISLCEGMHCRNTLGSYQCYCQDGFWLAGDGSSCHDIDECVQNISLCEGMHCRNTLGSYQCYCEDGFWLAGYGNSCHDIDECTYNPCEQHCNNTLGSYMCSCYARFVLSRDKHTCQCQSGYELTADRTKCVDVDECLDGNGGCDHICINTNGSYTCACYVNGSLTSANTLCLLSPLFISISILQTCIIFALIITLIVTCICWKRGKSVGNKESDNHEHQIYTYLEPKSVNTCEQRNYLYLDEEELRGALTGAAYPADDTLYIPMESAQVEIEKPIDDSRYMNLSDM